MIKRLLTKAVVLAAAFFGLATVAEAKPSLTDRIGLMWQVPPGATDEELDLMKQKGINVVQSFGLAAKPDSVVQAFLDRMHKHGFGVILFVAAVSKNNGKAGEWVIDEERVTTVVNKWKGHPAIFAWQMFDEPANNETPTAIQERAYAFAKKIDPEHAVFADWNASSNRAYKFFSEKAFDILDLHAYITDAVGPRQKNLLASFQAHRKGSYPVTITIAALNRPNRPALPAGALQQQYDFFFRQNDLTRNVGFYGWSLSPNKGIANDPDLMRQFKELQVK